mmetsp:Transcript_2089/g.13489  ORF Transcript_2089/g.13489 Transcript_2089/m.13489 type:complete len:339 (+) Transcript_2089:4549-5565(+)
METSSASPILPKKRPGRGTPADVEAMLRRASGGVYTSASVRGAARVPCWPDHLARLTKGWRRLQRTEEQTNDGLERHVLDAAREALRGSESIDEGPMEGKKMLCVCVYKLGKEATTAVEAIWTVVPGPAGQEPSPACILGRKRIIPTVKYTDWVHEREILKTIKPPDCGEVLLADERDGSILEGMVSNFYALVQQGETVVLQTAPVESLALPGISRKCVLQACRKLGIPVQETSPKVGERSSWLGAFVTNSVRGISPISGFTWYESPKDPGYLLTCPSEEERIAQGIQLLPGGGLGALGRIRKHDFVTFHPYIEKIKEAVDRIETQSEVDLLVNPESA